MSNQAQNMFKKNKKTKLISILGLCVDNLNSGDFMGLWHCDYDDYPEYNSKNINQSLLYNSDYSIKLAAYDEEYCMNLSESSVIDLSDCGDKNAWWYEPVHQNLIYVEAEDMCLDVWDDGVTGARLRGHSCLNNEFQKFAFESESGRESFSSSSRETQ